MVSQAKMLSWAAAVFLGSYISSTFASEFRVLEITQEQVDALKISGKPSANTSADFLSPDGSTVSGTAGRFGISWVWTVDEGLNYPYYFDNGYRVSAISNNGTYMLMLGASVENKLLSRGITARHPSIIDATQLRSGSYNSSVRLKPNQKWVDGKRVYVLSPTSSNSVNGKYVQGAQASALSANEGWVVGGIVLEDRTKAEIETSAFRWREKEGFEILPRPKGWPENTPMRAADISADGQVIVGMIEEPNSVNPSNKQKQLHRPFIWKVGDMHSTVLEHLLPDESIPRTEITGISGDGSTLVGHAFWFRPRQDGKEDYFTRAFVWKKESGYQIVSEPDKGIQSTRINGVSYDGTVLAGEVKIFPDNYDGSVRERLTSRQTGVIWENGKAAKANDYLKAHGLDLGKLKLPRVSSVSHDGKVFIGGAEREETPKLLGWIASLRDDGIPLADRSLHARADAVAKQTEKAATPTSKSVATTIQNATPANLPTPTSVTPPVPVSMPTNLKKTAADNSTKPVGQTPATPPIPEWEVVGYWDYDGADGQMLSAGLHVIQEPGQNLGQQWDTRLEMVSHASLPKRQRVLWPVYLNRKKKQVCAPYPGYPSYSVKVNLVGNEYDGIYQISGCKPE